jgi:hypothetical protein
MLHINTCCKHSFKCFRCFIRMLQVFHLDVAYVCKGFQVFSVIFASVSNVSSVLFCMLQLLVSTCFKNRLRCCTWDARGNVGDVSRWHGQRCPGWHEWHPGWRRPTAGALARMPDALRYSLACCAGTVRMLAPRIRHPGASKSESYFAVEWVFG